MGAPGVAARAVERGMLGLAAASAHHVTLLFGSVLFAVPVLWLAWSDARAEEKSGPAVLGRGLIFVISDRGGSGSRITSLLDCHHPPPD